MKLTLRPYQNEAVESIFKYYEDGGKENILCVLPTATGKSLVIADFIRRALNTYPETRIIVGTHVKELVSQDYEEFYRLCPEILSGIYSAGLKKRDTDEPVLFVGIQSVYNKGLVLGKCDLLLVDEAHLIPKKGQGMWRTFIDTLKITNPHMKVVGFTATPFRMDTGLLTKGEGKIFDHICYNYPLLRAIEEGYVCPVIPKNMDTKYDISKVATLAGDYKKNEVEKVYDVDDKTEKAVDEILAYGATRNSWLIFSAGNSHAEHLYQCLLRRGISCAIVTDSTPDGVRDQAVRDIKSGAIKALVNNLVFTTGFNAPNVDMIACFRPTKSPGLWVQIVGRGFRLHPEKTDCLILDFARNADRHGPIDQINGREKKKCEGDAPIKNCPKCHAVCFAGVRECQDCGFEFPEPEKDIRTTASTAALLSTQVEPTWHDVITQIHTKHVKNGVASMKIEYKTYGGKFYEYVCFEHMGYARTKAISWHRRRLPDHPVPNKVNAALETMYPPVSRIAVVPEGKYWRVSDVAFDETQTIIPEPEVVSDIEIPF